MRREIPLGITIFVGFLAIVSFFSPPLEGLGEDFTLFFDIIAVFAFFLGGGNLVRIHASKLIKRKTDWIYSIVTLIGFFGMLAAGLFKIGNPGDISTSVTAPGSLFSVLYYNLNFPLGSTMYSLLAFYVASASYRAFRAKNREATVLLVAAFIILLGSTPFGTMLTSWIPRSFDILQIPNLAVWILSSPNLAGQRAIMIGIGLGVVSMSLRLILGIERTYLGDERG
jgi:peptidoglycan/LPS O-acetylase OafA/YrhL